MLIRSSNDFILCCCNGCGLKWKLSFSFPDYDIKFMVRCSFRVCTVSIAFFPVAFFLPSSATCKIDRFRSDSFDKIPDLFVCLIEENRLHISFEIRFDAL